MDKIKCCAEPLRIDLGDHSDASGKVWKVWFCTMCRRTGIVELGD